jgi:hypothetical protein
MKLKGSGEFRKDLIKDYDYDIEDLISMTDIIKP